MWLGHSQRTSSLSSDKKKSAKSPTQTRTLKLITHEIVFTYQGQTSWIYFTPRKDPKAEGERKFKQVIRDSGWKGAKLKKVHPIPKAKDPPLTKAQKDAVRKGNRAKASPNPRRTRRTGSNKPKPKKVSGTGGSTSLSRILEAGPPRKKVSKTKLSKNK